MRSVTPGFGVLEADSEFMEAGRRGAGDWATLTLATERSRRLMSASPASVLRSREESDGDSVGRLWVFCGARRCWTRGDGGLSLTVTGRTVGEGGRGMAATALTSARMACRAGGVLSPTMRSKSLTRAFTRPTGGGIGAGAANDDARTGRFLELS